jgi:hypothetical protein
MTTLTIRPNPHNTMSCILFLDFDGVTHPDPCRKELFFCKLPLIENVLRQQSAVDVVVSSSWRYDHSLREIQSLFAPDIAARIVGVTPSVSRTDDEGWIPRHLLQHHREWECRKWLRQNHSAETPWLAIDDMAAWFTPNCSDLLSTNASDGFHQSQISSLQQMIEKRMGEPYIARSSQPQCLRR